MASSFILTSFSGVSTTRGTVDEQPSAKEELVDRLLSAVLAERFVLQRSHPAYTKLEGISRKLVAASPHLPFEVPTIGFIGECL